MLMKTTYARVWSYLSGFTHIDFGKKSDHSQLRYWTDKPPPGPNSKGSARGEGITIENPFTPNAAGVR